MTVDLHAPRARPAAQLDGFKARALRAAPARRHLYRTEWSLSDAVAAPTGSGTSILALGSEHFMRVSATSTGERQSSLMDVAHPAEWAAIVLSLAVAAGREVLGGLSILEQALVAVQAQEALASPPTAWLLTTGVPLLVGTSPARALQAGTWGFGRGVRFEATLPVRCVYVACEAVRPPPPLKGSLCMALSVQLRRHGTLGAVPPARLGYGSVGSARTVQLGLWSWL